MATKARVPSKAKLSRAGHDAHSKNSKVRKEAMEVLALAPHKKPKGKAR